MFLRQPTEDKFEGLLMGEGMAKDSKLLCDTRMNLMGLTVRVPAMCLV